MPTSLVLLALLVPKERLLFVAIIAVVLVENDVGPVTNMSLLNLVVMAFSVLKMNGSVYPQMDVVRSVMTVALAINVFSLITMLVFAFLLVQLSMEVFAMKTVIQQVTVKRVLGVSLF